MGLYTPAMLSYWLGDAVLDVRPGAAEPHCEGGIKLLDQGESVLRAECLYIGTAQAVTHALQRQVRGRNASRCAYAD